MTAQVIAWPKDEYVFFLSSLLYKFKLLSRAIKTARSSKHYEGM
jgi:hypothetical protein